MGFSRFRFVLHCSHQKWIVQQEKGPFTFQKCGEFQQDGIFGPPKKQVVSAKEKNLLPSKNSLSRKRSIGRIYCLPQNANLNYGLSRALVYQNFPMVGAPYAFWGMNLQIWNDVCLFFWKWYFRTHIGQWIFPWKCFCLSPAFGTGSLSGFAVTKNPTGKDNVDKTATRRKQDTMRHW